VGDSYGQRQLRNIGVDALTGNTATNAILSDDQRKYVDGVAPQQAAATKDETLNGTDAWRRLRENG
jgi:hypothetical protein